MRDCHFSMRFRDSLQQVVTERRLSDDRSREPAFRVGDALSQSKDIKQREGNGSLFFPLYYMLNLLLNLKQQVKICLWLFFSDDDPNYEIMNKIFMKL